MSKGRIKAVLFIIVFLLVIAVAVNLLVDMQSERKAEATPTNDPYANTVTPSVDMQPALETPQPTPAIVPSVAPTATPTPAAPVPTATPTPVPTATPEPIQPVIPQGEVIGSGSFIPGFEDQLVGMEAEKDGEVHVTFPEQYAENLAGKDATFKVKIHAIREPQLPELDDEFAKDVSEFDTLDEYKADIRKNLTEARAADAERNFKTEIMNKALDNMSVTIPESMIAEKTDEFLRNYADSLGIGRNVSRADLIKGLGMTEESFTAMMRPGAERQVQADLLLDAVVKAEDLHASDEDKEKFYKQLEEDYGENAEKVKGMIDEHLMMQDIERRKAADLIYSSAVKTAPKAEEAPVEENKD